MQPLIYDPNKSARTGPKPVMLALRVTDGRVQLIAVDDAGDLVAHLVGFGSESIRAIGYAKGRLERAGYDTSFTDWNDRGGIVLE